MKMSSLRQFILNNMNNYSVVHDGNIQKIFNKDFEILVNNQLKKTQIMIIDKKNNTVYNNIDIATHYISTNK